MARYTDQGCFFFKAALADRSNPPPKRQDPLGAEQTVSSNPENPDQQKTEEVAHGILE